ncbi:hypothetical protein SmJEL517_g03316 [Synchytrium microbalum]|uniref:Eukaryotic translation initiation factor 4 gamma 2 n=1 Tax=Synchytrium microbalum TaxID=1806994 RepID=A0A507C8N5_9FUNG|nr:uncharacterized protein SmJEL517_g03316 [Synchytrium microbalum]TPX33893.1 hypothetical protein SmJEL517_g03316 [Synchytrium microbalum]
MTTPPAPKLSWADKAKSSIKPQEPPAASINAPQPTSVAPVATPAQHKQAAVVQPTPPVVVAASSPIVPAIASPVVVAAPVVNARPILSFAAAAASPQASLTSNGLPSPNPAAISPDVITPSSNTASSTPSSSVPTRLTANANASSTGSGRNIVFGTQGPAETEDSVVRSPSRPVAVSQPPQPTMNGPQRPAVMPGTQQNINVQHPSPSIVAGAPQQQQQQPSINMQPASAASMPLASPSQSIPMSGMPIQHQQPQQQSVPPQQMQMQGGMQQQQQQMPNGMQYQQRQQQRPMNQQQGGGAYVNNGRTSYVPRPQPQAYVGQTMQPVQAVYPQQQQYMGNQQQRQQEMFYAQLQQSQYAIGLEYQKFPPDPSTWNQQQHFHYKQLSDQYNSNQMLLNGMYQPVYQQQQARPTQGNMPMTPNGGQQQRYGGPAPPVGAPATTMTSPALPIAEPPKSKKIVIKAPTGEEVALKDLKSAVAQKRAASPEVAVVPPVVPATTLELAVPSTSETGRRLSTSGGSKAIPIVNPKEKERAKTPQPAPATPQTAAAVIAYPAANGEVAVPAKEVKEVRRSPSPVKKPADVVKAAPSAAKVEEPVKPAVVPPPAATKEVTVLPTPVVTPAKETVKEAVKEAVVPSTPVEDKASISVEEPIQASNSSDSDGTKVELEEGEVVDDGKSKPIADSATEEVDGQQSPSLRISTSRAPKVTSLLTSFDGVKYPSGVEAPKKDGERIRYTISFLSALGALAKPIWKPSALQAFHEAFDEPKSAGRPSAGGSARSSAAGGRAVSRVGSQSDLANMGSAGGRPSTSEQRFQQGALSRGGGFTGVMSSGVQPSQGARGGMGGRTGSGTGLNHLAGGRDQQQSRQSVGGRDQGQFGRGVFDSRGGRQPSRGGPPPEPIVPLNRSDNAWVPHNLPVPGAKRPGEADVDPELAKILRKVKSLLNKLTLERFDSLAIQVRDVGITNRDILEGVIELIFDKALDEPNFGAMYAQLCNKLHQELPERQPWMSNDPRNSEFRRALLNKCQREFQSGKSWAKDEDQAREMRKKVDTMTAEEKEEFAEAQYQRDKLKRRTLGNIRFVGELFKQSLITEKIMHECIQQLLRNHSDPEEEETESLCKLIATIGQQLDRPVAKQFMDTYFTQLKKLVNDNRLSSRIRFMVQDIIDMRKAGWQARQQSTGPKTLAEIREDAKRKEEEAEQERIRNQSRGGGGGRQGSGSRNMPSMSDQMGRSSRGGGVPPTTDGWTNIQRGGSSAKAEKMDHSQFGRVQSAIKKDSDPSTMRLGPGTGMGTGAKGWAMTPKTDSGTAMARTASTSSQSSVTAAPSAVLPTKAVAGVEANANMFGLLAADGDRRKSVDDGEHPVIDTDVADKKVTFEEKPPLSAEPVKLTEKVATRKIDAMIEEFFANYDNIEAGKDFIELGEEWHARALSAILDKATDKKRPDYIKTADLFCYLYENTIVSADTFVTCLTQYVEFIEDISVDVPGVFGNLAVILSRLLDLGVIQLTQFTDICSSIVNATALSLPAPKLLAETLYEFRREYGGDRLVASIGDSGFNVRELFPPTRRNDDSIAEFLDNKLEDKKLFELEPSLKVSRGLRPMLGRDDVTKITAFLDSTSTDVGGFSHQYIHVITKTLCRYVASLTIFANGSKTPVEMSVDLFTKIDGLVSTVVKPVLEHVINMAEKSQQDDVKVEILMATEAYCAEVSFPPSLLENLFRLFLKHDIVDEPNCFAWKKAAANNTEGRPPAEQQKVDKWLLSLQTSNEEDS